MKNLFLFTFLFLVSALNAQKTPTLLIDGTPVKFQGDLSLPYWVSAGKTIGFSVNAISASVLEFNVDSNELQFNQVLHLTTSGTVPTGKAWKIEAIGLGPNSADISTSGFSTAAMPEIFTSPVTFSTSGTYSWIIPPGVTNICVEAWGGGGKGGTGSSTFGNGGAGGGGGGYGYDCFTVVPGTSYTLTVGGSGQASSLGTLMLANGGTNGTNGTSTASGVPGTGSSSTASFNMSGEDGSAYSSSCGASNSSRGGNGANGGLGGLGTIRGGSSCSTYSVAQSGAFPGGGGGGGGSGGINSIYKAGKDGADGQIIIYF